MALPTPLTGKQRRYLRSLGHHLDPVVQVGWQGVTEQVQRQLVTALRDHELVKVKLAQSVGDRPEAAEELAEFSRSECVQVLGRTCLFYRPRPNDPKILPPGLKPPPSGGGRAVSKKKVTKKGSKKVAKKAAKKPSPRSAREP